MQDWVFRLGVNEYCKIATTLLGGMPIKFIGNSFVMFYTKHLPLEIIGNYDVCELPL